LGKKQKLQKQLSLTSSPSTCVSLPILYRLFIVIFQTFDFFVKFQNFSRRIWGCLELFSSFFGQICMILNTHRFVLHVFSNFSANLRTFLIFPSKPRQSYGFSGTNSETSFISLEDLRNIQVWSKTHPTHEHIFFWFQQTKQTLTFFGKDRNSRSNSLSQIISPHASLSLYLLIFWFLHH
jgi:hypothetical protein